MDLMVWCRYFARSWSDDECLSLIQHALFLHLLFMLHLFCRLHRLLPPFCSSYSEVRSGSLLCIVFRTSLPKRCELRRNWRHFILPLRCLLLIMHVLQALIDQPEVKAARIIVSSLQLARNVKITLSVYDSLIFDVILCQFDAWIAGWHSPFSDQRS